MRIMANSSGRSSGEATDGSRNCLSAASVQPAGTLEGDEPAMPDARIWHSLRATPPTPSWAWQSGRSAGKRSTSASSSSPPSSLAASTSWACTEIQMDKATILSEATQHLKQLQEKVKALELEAEAAGVNHVSPSSAARKRNPPLPAEIQVRFSEIGVMVIIFCDHTKGVAVRVLSEVEEGLHLRIIHANVMPFMASTVTITIATKVEEEFTVTAEDIVERLNSVLQQQSSCSSTEETGN